MAGVVYVRPIPISKRGVSEFLTTESYSPTEIHRRLRSVYGQDATDVSSDGHWQRGPKTKLML
jgi:NADPH-dependent ferric siderophore reductase